VMIKVYHRFMNSELKERAIVLRRQGLTYREILAEIPVAKSTLSDWLHSVALSREQKQRLTEKKLEAIRKGGRVKHLQKIAFIREITEIAKLDVGLISDREFWFMGIMLYWAEGSKEKEYGAGKALQFTNTDPEMINLFIRWLSRFFGKTFDDFTLSLWIHDLQKTRTEEIITFWAEALNCPREYIRYIYYKKGNPKTKRKNTGDSYHGTVRVTVKSSSTLNRKIAGWVQGVVNYFR